MAKNNVADYSTAASSNTDLAGISIAEGMAPSNVNNAMREGLAQEKKWWNDLGGQVTVGGTGNAITITSSSVYQSLVSGIRFAFKPSADNSGATTLTLDGLTSKAVRKISGGTDVALTGGEILSGSRAEVLYDSTANAAAGAWILLNPANPVTGGQIKFPATQNASSDANTLDDYKEGTWTPAITFGGGSTGLTYTTQTGTYTKIGRMVMVQAAITLSAKGSSTGTFALIGMPFATAVAFAAIPDLGNVTYSGLTAGFVLVLNAGSSNFSARGLTTTGQTSTASITDATFSATSVLNFSAVYSV